MLPDQNLKRPLGRKRKYWTKVMMEDLGVDRQFSRDVRFRGSWISDEWVDSMRTLAEHRDGLGYVQGRDIPVKNRIAALGVHRTDRDEATHPLNAVYDTGGELYLETWDSRVVGGVGVLVNTNMAVNIAFFEQLTTRIGRLRMRRCGPTPVLTIFVVEEKEVEAFYMELEFYSEDHAFYKIIIVDFNDNIDPRRTPGELHIGTPSLQWNGQGERLSEFIMTTKTTHGNSLPETLLSTLEVGVTRWRVS
ncbi:hypothetical protein RB195_019130 [Necator americanus]|uniref:Uncharacterized protein n=1 Tax=Necator americanus TaxID=51031 RepID=A0ABR1CF11_NECAM